MELDSQEKQRKILINNFDMDDDLWDVNKIFRHKVDKVTGMVQLYVNFKNGTNEMSWIDMNSLVIQDPIPILVYINKHHLQRDKHIGWVTKLSHNGDHKSQLSRAYVMMTKPYEKKFKFGVQVPRGTREAYHLDLQN